MNRYNRYSLASSSEEEVAQQLKVFRRLQEFSDANPEHADEMSDQVWDSCWCFSLPLMMKYAVCCRMLNMLYETSYHHNMHIFNMIVIVDF